jgi:hypothetical protein
LQAFSAFGIVTAFADKAFQLLIEVRETVQSDTTGHLVDTVEFCVINELIVRKIYSHKN